MLKNLILFRKRKYLIVTLFLLGLFIINIPRVMNAWQENSWSIQFLKTVGGGAENIFLNIPEPPPFHKRSSLWLAELALDEGYLDETQLLIESLVEDRDKYALLILGNLQAARGEFSDALQTLYESGHYQALIQRATDAEDEADYTSAVIAAEAAWKLNPEAMTIKLSYILEDADRIDDARLLLIGMLNDFPTSTSMIKWMLRLGDLSRQNMLWEDAIYYYQKVIYEEPDNIQARIGLGWVFYETGADIESALGEFEEALSFGSDPGPVYFAIGRVLTKEQRYQEADRYYVKAVEQNPDNRWWGLVRANNLRKTGNLSEALYQYNKLIRSHPDWAKAYYEIAWLHRMNNNPGDAIWAIEQALMLQDQKETSSFLRAGKIYEWADMTDIALDVYRQALSLSPENQSAKLAIERLSETEP